MLRLPRERTALLTVMTLVAAAIVLFPPGARAAVIQVTSPADVLGDDGMCTLREAIDNANADSAVWMDCPAGAGADTITFAGDLGVITLDIDDVGGSEDENQSGDLDITSIVTIQGAGEATTTIKPVTPNENYRSLHVLTPGHLTLNDLSVTGGMIQTGEDGGGILVEGALTTEQVTLSGNSAYSSDGFGNFGDGGNLAVTTTGSAVLMDTTVQNGETDGNGGGIHVDGGDLEIYDGTIRGNITEEGNGFGNGGGLYADQGDVDIYDSTITNNESDLGGGGIYFTGASTLTVVGSNLSHNDAGQEGSPGGGGIFATAGAQATISDSSFEANRVDEGGGAIDIFGGATNVVVSRSLFFDNSAGIQGVGAGAIFVLGDGDTRPQVSIETSTFQNNIGEAGPGAILALESDVIEIVNSTLYANSGTGPGGAGAVWSNAPLTILHTTFVENTGSMEEMGQINVLEGTEFHNNVMKHLPGEPNCRVVPSFDFATSSGNVFSDGGCGGGPSDLEDTDPMLGTFESHEGPSWIKLFDLLPGSPAIDLGEPDHCSEGGITDQRGKPRPMGLGCDSGSYEVQPPQPAPTTYHNLHVFLGGAGRGSVTGDTSLGIACPSDCDSELAAFTWGRLTAVPSEDSDFAGWSGGCAEVTDQVCVIHLTSTTQVTATFGTAPPSSDTVDRGPCKGFAVGSTTDDPVTGGLVVVGTPGADEVTGSPRADVICGLGGDDTLVGNAGADRMRGGPGDDILIGGSGPDRLNGGMGDNICLPGPGKDIVRNCRG